MAFGRNPNTLYLGLGDPYDQILVGGAMVKSRNGGVSWDPMIELGDAVSVRDVKVDTSTNRDIVLVATEQRPLSLGGRRADVQRRSHLRRPGGLEHRADERGLARLGAALSRAPTSACSAAQATTLYLSTDLGATWAPITNAGNVFALNGRTTLGVAVPGDSVVYAYSSTQTDVAMRDVYRSADGGQTWVANGVNSTKVPTNPVTGASVMADMNICHGQCWYNQMVLVDPQDATRNTVWIGGDLATARTTDGGGSWTIKTWWLYSQVPGRCATPTPTTTPPPSRPRERRRVILGNDGGMNISEDNGASFSSDKNNGLVDAPVLHGGRQPAASRTSSSAARRTTARGCAPTTGPPTTR